MNIVLVPIEGVLADGEDLKTAFPLKWAKALYEALHTQYRIVALTRADQELARWWLGRNEFRDLATVLSWDGPLEYHDWLVDQVRDFLANAWEVAFMLTNSHEVAARVHHLGVMSLTIGTPTQRPGWKAEDETFVPWENLTERLLS